jgi:predicted nucleotidyltransferase
MRLSKDQKEFVGLLNSKGVEYVLVGGHAVGFHGYPRYTGDMDFFVGANAENAQRLAGVIQEFGFGDLPFEQKDLEQPHMVFQIGRPPNRIDLLTSITAVKFEQAWSTREKVEIEGTFLWIIDRELLIRNKLASSRPHDLDDAETLQRRSKVSSVRKRAKNP